MDFFHISEPTAVIVAALIGAIATYVVAALPERKKRPSLIANFLDEIAKSVTEMITMFEKEEIPHQAGHELNATINFFEKGTQRKILSDMARETLTKLKELSQDAVVVDVVLFSGENGETLRKEWVKKAKGIVGELQGEAAKLRARF